MRVENFRDGAAEFPIGLPGRDKQSLDSSIMHEKSQPYALVSSSHRSSPIHTDGQQVASDEQSLMYPGPSFGHSPVSSVSSVSSVSPVSTESSD